MSMPMAPSCVNMALNLAPMVFSSTLGAFLARLADVDKIRSTDIKVPRLQDCSGGTKRMSALPHLCGSSLGSTRSGTEPLSSSYKSGKPCEASSARDPDSTHSPIFLSADTPVTSFSSYCENECFKPPSAPSGPSPVIPSSSALLSSTAS